jgi:hypothetical protein
MVTSEFGAAVVYSGIGLYITGILVSFVYPTAKVNRKAQRLREEHLDRYRAKVRSLERKLPETPSETAENNELALQMEIERARKEFRDYRNVRLYPLSIGIITRLLSSVFLPIGFTVFELYVSKLI